MKTNSKGGPYRQTFDEREQLDPNVVPGGNYDITHNRGPILDVKIRGATWVDKLNSRCRHEMLPLKRSHGLSDN